MLWTDWGFPVLDFNIFLTGYDVQGINLYDVLVRATVAPGPGTTGGTSSNVTVPSNPTSGSQPAQNDANPKLSIASCGILPGTFLNVLLQDLQLVFTTGKATGFAVPCTKQVGGTHANAIGYATIDVVSFCSTSLPTQKNYWTEILYDNVLTGDYQQVTRRGDRLTVQGGPLVHIRAVPEGGAAGAMAATTLPTTFYERYTTLAPQPKMDRRQPLPSVFAPRFISGGASGLNTALKIWREGVVPAGAACSAYSSNRNLPFTEIVRFDEHENATVFGGGGITIPVPPPPMSATMSVSVQSGFFPYVNSSGDVGGWLYLNLTSQNWVITSMFAEAINGTDAAAIALGNGCTPATPYGARIGPAGSPKP